MWLFHILAGVMSAGLALRLIRPILRGGRRGDRMLALSVVAGAPLLALCVYLPLGRPGLPGRPKIFEDVMETRMEHYALLARLPMERLAGENPDDTGALMSLGAVNMRLKRYDDALAFFARAVKVSGERGEQLHPAFTAALGEAQVEAAGGVVGGEAKRTFEYLLSLDGDSSIARYNLALWKAQNGKKREALDEWRALLNDGYPDIWWKKRLREQISRVREELKAEGE